MQVKLKDWKWEIFKKRAVKIDSPYYFSEKNLETM